jgi:monoamine oxidase
MSLQTILVIGGGIAGLGAAAELLRHGRTVILIESRDRFGGRIHTAHSKNLAIELGAEFLHGKNEAISSAIKAARLSVHSASPRNRFFDNGALRDVALWDEVGELFHQIDPRLPDESFRAFVDRMQIDNARRRLALGFVEGFDAANPERISSHALLRGEYAAENMGGAEQQRVDAGYGALIQYFVTALREAGARLVTNATLRKLAWRPGGVTALIDQEASTTSVSANAAIVTLPLGVLKAGVVAFDPPLPDKVEAANALEFGNVTKLTFLFRSQWWPDRDFGFIHALSEAIPTWWSHPHGHLITGWAGGPKADALLQMSMPELKARALEILARIFEVPVEKVTREVSSVHFHNWAKDQFSRGAYSYVPVNGLDLPKLLAASVQETLFFAGEATVFDAQMGTVFGAYGSGLRAASEILAMDRH